MRKGWENARSDNVLLLKPKFSDTLRPSDATNSEPISSIKNLVERIIPRVPPRIVESTLHLVRRLPARGRSRLTHIWPTPLPPRLPWRHACNFLRVSSQRIVSSPFKCCDGLQQVVAASVFSEMALQQTEEVPTPILQHPEIVRLCLTRLPQNECWHYEVCYLFWQIVTKTFFACYWECLRPLRTFNTPQLDGDKLPALEDKVMSQVTRLHTRAHAPAVINSTDRCKAVVITISTTIWRFSSCALPCTQCSRALSL